MNWYDDSPPAGMVHLEPGDVTLVHGEPYLCVSVNDCRAWLEPLSKRHVERTTRLGQHVEFDAAGKGVGTSTTREPGDILERRGRKAAEDFLAARARRRKGNIDGLAATTNERTDEMANKLRALKGEKKTRKPRGGLAADMAAGPTPEEKAADKAAKDAKKAEEKAARDAAKAARVPRASSFAGITPFIYEQVKAGKRNQELLEAVRAKYPGCGPAWVAKREADAIAKDKAA